VILTFTLDEYKVQSSLCVALQLHMIAVTPCWYNLWHLSGTSLYAKFSRDSETKSSTIAESDKVLIPEDQDDSASVTDQLENPDITTEDAQVFSPSPCGICLFK
jgi:hypothetical protein